MTPTPGDPNRMDVPDTLTGAGVSRTIDSAPTRAAGAEVHVLQLLRRVIRAVDIYNRKLRTEYSITAPQLIALHAVIDRGPISVAEIAKAIHLGSSTLVGILDRLETRGLVTRSRSEKDRRVVLVSSTDAGRELARRAPSPLQDRLAEGLRQLDRIDQEAIERALMQVVDLMEASDLDAAPYLETGRLDAE